MIFVLMNQVQTVLVSSLQPSWHISISLQTKVTYKSQFLVYQFTTYLYLSVFATIFHENLCKSDYGVCDTKHEIVESVFGDDDDSDAVSSLYVQDLFLDHMLQQLIINLIKPVLEKFDICYHACRLNNINWLNLIYDLSTNLFDNLKDHINI